MQVGSTSRLLNADLDQPLMSVLGREDIRLAVRNVKVHILSHQPLFFKRVSMCRWTQQAVDLWQISNWR